MIKVILLDDEENALDNLDMMLKEAGDVEVLSMFQHPASFLAELQRLDQLGSLPDAVFIDIEMPELNGLEVAETVKELYPAVEVVFVTAYSEYAVQAFELHSLDYLLKPTNRKRLTKTLVRLQELKARNQTENDSRREVYFQSLGEFVLTDRRQSGQMRWRTRKVKELCACLLHDHHRAITTEELLERLFSESDTERAKVLFYTSMSYLRKSFKEIGYPEAIQKHENGYRFYLNHGMHWDYNELLHHLDIIETNGAAADWNALERLMAIYQGDYFNEIEQPEFIVRRLELRTRVLGAIRSVKDRYRKEGNRAREMDCLLKMFLLSPETEETALELIQLYVEQGRKEDAADIYRQFSRRVRDALGYDPSDKLSHYVRSLLGKSL